jgi:hypothetical protein
MINNNKKMLSDMPIAGQSLTHELGARPWQSPPQYNKPQEAIKHYFERLSNPEDGSKILSALEMGVPVETLTEAIQLGGVMEGLHTIDVGVIISPVIAEILIGLAESAEIEYTVEDEDMEEKKKPTEADVAVAIDDMDSDTTKPIVEENMVIDEEEPKGLMARRNNDGI